jgi:hypothetical protein
MSIQLIRELDNSAGTLMSAVGGIMADRSRKMDFNAPFGALAFETDIDSDGLHVPHVVLEGNAGVPTTRYEFTQHALAQLMERLRIDIRTARYILQRSPREATELVNALLAKKGEETMLLRTFDGNGSNPVARSFLSPSYKILDHEDVLETMLPVLAESDGAWESVRAGSSDQRMLFSFKSRTITADASPLKLGDMTALGVQLTNSEVGSGSASLSQLLWTLACLNGMSTSNKIRKTHLGKARTESDVSLLTSDTKDKIKTATLAELSDSLAAYSSVESFDSQVALFTAAHNNEVPLESLTSTEQRLALCARVAVATGGNKKDSFSILEALSATTSQAGYVGRPISQATIANAVTAVANSPDRGIDDAEQWQRGGAKILSLSSRAWRTLVEPSAVALAA